MGFHTCENALILQFKKNVCMCKCVKVKPFKFNLYAKKLKKLFFTW